MNDTTLGVIPARAGSKRVPRKNIREVGGKPLIAHTIEQADQAKRLDQVIVSTEDEEIREAAEVYGGTAPFQRPAELATDEATNDEVVQHALDWFESKGKSFDYVCLLSVTTPFRDVDDINEAVAKLQGSSADSLVSVRTYDVPPFWAVEMNEGNLEPYFEKNSWEKTRTQDFPTLHHPNGSIFAARVHAFEDAGGFYTDHTIGYEMSEERSLDIDEPFDLEIARALYSWRDQ